MEQLGRKGEPKIDFQVILSRRVAKQPVPFLAKCGDCSYCCLAGMMDCTVEEAYKRCDREEYSGVSWSEFRQNLYELKHRGHVDRIINDNPIWPAHMSYGECAGWGIPSYSMAQAWGSYVLMALDAGYYGFCSTIMRPNERKYNGSTDHKVMICGYRVVSTPHYAPDGKWSCATVDNEILVSCSSLITPDEEWVKVYDFLKERGGFNIQFARPTNKK